MVDLSRRDFMLVGTSSVLALPGGVGRQIDGDPGTDYQFQGVADLMGPAAARPEPGDDFFDDKIAFWYRYEATDTGERSFYVDGDTSWTTISMIPTNQLEEVAAENPLSFFNHTFARPEAPDTKNWNFTAADITKDASELELVSTTELVTTQWGNYPPGSEATPGVAFRLTGTPTAGEAFAGYATDNNGLVVGEDTTDSFAELRKGGDTFRVYRSDWNGEVPGGRVWDENRPIITRMPHLFYGGGDLAIKVLLHGQHKSGMTTLHTFTPENVDGDLPDGPPIDQPNLPIRFESDGLSGGNLRANACHYQFSLSESENRVNGHAFGPTSVAETGWTPLLAWRKRAGWEVVNVKPLKINVIATDNDVKIGLQIDPTLSGGTWSLAPNTSSSETAVETNPGVTLDATGERRYADYAPAGQGNSPGQSVNKDLKFNLPASQPVVLVAQSVGGVATASGVVGWEEYF